MNTQPKIILDLCGGSGSWSRPYVQAGYDVRLVTLPAQDVRTYEPPSQVHGILAAPPCTEFSIAKGSRPRDFTAGLEIVDACLRIIRQCALARTLEWWCLENPRGFLRQFLGKPALSAHYWWYGSTLDKPTDLWGYFTFPKRIYKEPPILLQSIMDVPNWDGGAPAARSTTPVEFAHAFFLANQ